jgi:hypothetical protein
MNTQSIKIDLPSSADTHLNQPLNVAIQIGQYRFECDDQQLKVA